MVHLAGVGLALGLFTLLPALSAAGPTGPTAASNCSNAQSSYGVAGNVTWNGANICTSTSSSSALSVDLSQTDHLRYNWSVSAGPSLNITDARLAMFYFGFPVATRDVTQTGARVSTSGTIAMDWTPGAISFVLAGLYSLTASLLDSNGTTVWSESFFVNVTAPYTILAVLPIVLLLIAVYEIYSVARSGRQAALGRKAPPSPPRETPPAEPTETPAPAPAEAEPSEGAPVVEKTP